MLKDLSIVIPLYNEEKGTEEVVKNLINEFEKTNVSYELVLVNNGSTDSTQTIIDNLLKKHPQVKTTKVEKNIGYGFGINSGLKKTNGKVIGWIDGDAQIKPKEIIKVYYNLINKNLDIIKGRRKKRDDGLWRIISSFIYTFLVNILFLNKIKDTNGKPKLMKREVYQNLVLESKDWFLDTEILIKALNKGYKYGEKEVIFNDRQQGKSNVKLITVSEFLYNLFHFRWILWKKNLKL